MSAPPLNTTQLKCVSANNQKYKARPETVNANAGEPVFYPFSIKTSKCSDICNNINDPYAKMCVSDVVKNLNVKVLNIMPRTIETRHIKWHETCKSTGRLDESFCSNKQQWNDDKCKSECKELIDKGVCDKRSIWNPINCECACNKPYDVVEYLDYENCTRRKKLVDKLVEECTKQVEEAKLSEMSLTECNSIESNSVENIHKFSSCTLYIVLFSLIFTINIGIATHFVCYKSINKKLL